jgi:hypothetical protein
MKKNSFFIWFVLVPSLILLSVLLKDFYRSTLVRPGTLWIEVRNEENPFEKPDTTFYRVLAVKSGYALVEIRHENYCDTTSYNTRVFALTSDKIK